MAEKPDKPNLIYAIICDDVRMEERNKVSLMGLFENIYLDKINESHPKFAIVTGWKGAAGTFKIEINLVSPDGKHSDQLGTANFELPDRKRIFRGLTFVHNWRAPSFGTYEVQIVLDGKIVRILHINVIPTDKTSGPKD